MFGKILGIFLLIIFISFHFCGSIVVVILPFYHIHYDAAEIRNSFGTAEGGFGVIKL